MPLIAATVLAVLSYKLWGNLPLWWLMAMWLICVFVGYLQQRMMTRFFGDNSADLGYFWSFLMPVLLGYLLSCGWLSRRICRS